MPPQVKKTFVRSFVRLLARFRKKKNLVFFLLFVIFFFFFWARLGCILLLHLRMTYDMYSTLGPGCYDELQVSVCTVHICKYAE